MRAKFINLNVSEKENTFYRTWSPFAIIDYQPQFSKIAILEILYTLKSFQSSYKQSQRPILPSKL